MGDKRKRSPVKTLSRDRKDYILRRLNEVYADRPDAAESELLKAIKAKVSLVVKQRW